MVNIFILFFRQETILESSHTAVSPEAEHIDKLIDIEANAKIATGRVGRRECDSGFFVIEDFGIVLPVLHTVEAVIFWHTPDFP